MALIAPTILATDLDDYRRQYERIKFANRIQIDISDGRFTDEKTINSIESHWSDGMTVDFHLMVESPRENLETLIAKNPHLVIVHAEADNIADALTFLHDHKQLSGLALLPDTTVESAAHIIELVDHCLIFGGHLGHMGGQADLSLLEKVAQIKAINPDIEIGWDGGANESNVRQLAEAGVDVINVGSAIQKTDNPERAHATLQSVVEDI